MTHKRGEGRKEKGMNICGKVITKPIQCPDCMGHGTATDGIHEGDCERCLGIGEIEVECRVYDFKAPSLLSIALINLAVGVVVGILFTLIILGAP